MSGYAKRIVSLLLLAFLAFHFLFIIHYSSPVKITGKTFNAITALYGYPYFHQQWTVFVPTPVKKFDLYLRKGSALHWQPWINVTQGLINKNRLKVFSGRETEVLLITNSINYLSYDIGEINKVFAEKPSLPSFTVLEYAVRHYFKHHKHFEKDKNYEMLLITASAGKTTAYYFKNLSLL